MSPPLGDDSTDNWTRVERSVQVRDIALARATDCSIWTYALEHNFAIVSKDPDCCQVSVVLGTHPKVIWVGRGNPATADIEAPLGSSRPAILAFGAEREGAFQALFQAESNLGTLATRLGR